MTSIREIFAQTNHCYENVIAFSWDFSNGKKSLAKYLEFGYYLGRLVTLLLKQGFVFRLYPGLTGYTRGMAKGVIERGLSDIGAPDQKIIDYGFAIGFMQEELDQRTIDWWDPIATLAINRKWSQVSSITRRKMSSENLLDASEKTYIPTFPSGVWSQWEKISDTLTADYYTHQQKINRSIRKIF